MSAPAVRQAQGGKTPLSRPRARRGVVRYVGGIILIVSVLQYALAQVIAASAWHPPYSWANNFISDLGNTACGPFAVPHGTSAYVCSPDHTLMNASFIVAGILTLAATLLLWRVLPARRLTTIGLALWLAAGLLKIVVGLAPENTSISLHLLGALNIPIGSLAILLLSIAIRTRYRALAWFGAVIAGVGLIGTILSSGAQYSSDALNLGLGLGGMERLASYPASLWLIVVGIGVITTKGRGPGPVAQSERSPRPGLRPRPAAG